MKRIVCTQPNHFEMCDVEGPHGVSGHALVRIKRIGICGTDMHAYRGRQPYFTYPRVLGHELAAEIVEIDENTNGLKKGDQVTILPYVACGKCIACRSGKTNCCTRLEVIGVHRDGGMQEMFAVPIANMIETNALSLDQSAITEPLAIGAHAVERANIQAGHDVAVIGAGPIGLAAMKFAKLAGANVIALDINTDRLTFCKDWVPVDHAVKATDQPLKHLEHITNGDLPRVVIDATGNVHSMNQSFSYAAHTGTVVYVGLVKDDITFYHPDFHKKELTLMSSRNATHDTFQHVIHHLRQGNIDADRYITHRASFADMIDAFDTWLQPETGVIKAMVEL